MRAASMQLLSDFHHYRADAIGPQDRVALCERRIIDMLLTTSLTDAGRESSVAFELKHHHSVAQLGRILSRKRNLPLDVCTAGALLHDIHVVQCGSYADHAHLGAPLALDVLREIGGFSTHELEQVHTIVFHHSDKHVWSDDPLAEFGKDADVLDCFLYPGAFDYYLRHKSLTSFAAYLKRAQLVWAELSIPAEPRFTILDDFTPGWLGRHQALGHQQAATTLDAIEMLAELDPGGPTCPPPFVARRAGSVTTLSTSAGSWDHFLSHMDDMLENAAAALGIPAGRRRALHRLLALDPTLSSDDHAALASSLPSGVLQQAPELSGSSILVWPALARYEPLPSTPSASPRGKELGL
jgi:hypothetical protein